MHTYTLPILPTRPTFEQAMDYRDALPPRARRSLIDAAVRDALADWPEGEGFGSSDHNWAVLHYLAACPDVVQREYGALADLEHRLIAQDFDWEAGARMFAPA
jgi:hypothetical protein